MLNDYSKIVSKTAIALLTKKVEEGTTSTAVHCPWKKNRIANPVLLVCMHLEHSCQSIPAILDVPTREEKRGTPSPSLCPIQSLG